MEEEQPLSFVTIQFVEPVVSEFWNGRNGPLDRMTERNRCIVSKQVLRGEASPETNHP